MFSPQFLTVFYSVAAVLIAVLVYRIWSKRSRATGLPGQMEQAFRESAERKQRQPLAVPASTMTQRAGSSAANAAASATSTISAASTAAASAVAAPYAVPAASSSISSSTSRHDAPYAAPSYSPNSLSQPAAVQLPAVAGPAVASPAWQVAQGAATLASDYASGAASAIGGTAATVASTARNYASTAWSSIASEAAGGRTSLPSSARWQDRKLFADVASPLDDDTAGFPPVDYSLAPTLAGAPRAFGPMTGVLASMLPETEERLKTISENLIASGDFNPHALANLNAWRYVLMMVPMLCFGVGLLFVPPVWEPLMLALAIGAPILGWSVPPLIVAGRAQERRREIEKAMPDFLDLMNMCVSQGLNVPDSLRRVEGDLQGVYPALSQELKIVKDQAQIGSLPVALKNFGRRVNVPEVNSFVSLMLQTQRMGTSVSESLQEYSDSMRESLKQRAEESGNRAAFWLLFPTVLCLMPAVYLFLLSPAVIKLSDFFSSGGRDALDSGSRAIERLNSNRALRSPIPETFDN